jgi:large subunit ribosomal protein L3
MIPGMIGKKIGMTQLFRDNGETVVTVIEAGPCFVTQIKTEEKDGYNAVQLGFGEAKRLNSPQKGHLKGVGLFKYLREFRVEDVSSFKLGQKVDVDIFKPGDLVDVTGTSKGKGFAGVVKRHHFAGGPKTHGQSDRHRAPGSVGATTFPGRVLKGTRMAGHMGDDRVTVRNLEIVDVDSARNVLLVKGAVPGGRNGLLLIRKAVKGS